MILFVWNTGNYFEYKPLPKGFKGLLCPCSRGGYGGARCGGGCWKKKRSAVEQMIGKYQQPDAWDFKMLRFQKSYTMGNCAVLLYISFARVSQGKRLISFNEGYLLLQLSHVCSQKSLFSSLSVILEFTPRHCLKNGFSLANIKQHNGVHGEDC